MSVLQMFIPQSPLTPIPPSGCGWGVHPAEMPERGFMADPEQQDGAQAQHTQLLLLGE